MKRLNELTFVEVKQMYEQALDLSVGFQTDAAKQLESDNTEKGAQLQKLHQEWTEYARQLLDELESRIKYALSYENKQAGGFI